MTVVGSSLEKVMHKFRRLKIFLKKWSKEKFWNVESELSACKMLIQSIEEAPLWDLDLEQKLFDLKLKKAKLDRDLEIKWRQRARISCLKHNLCPDLNLSNLSLNQISDASNQFLSQSFSRDEIKAALDQIDGSKAPGPDGLTFFFIKRAWFFLEVEIVQIFQDFFDDATIPDGMNDSFVCLIPKKDQSEKWTDYRPIGLINCAYKLLSKVLANRIRKVLPDEENQCAFVEGRFILDGVMTVSELISDLKLNHSMGLILIDFAKAFDSVSWVFLSKVMSSMGFNSSFCNWVHSCVSSARISVLVNVAEVLNKMIKYSLSNGNLKGIKITNSGDPLTHIQFADDTILFGDNSLEEMATWKSILEQFGDASGLKLNWDKCQLFGINVSLDELSSRAGIINCKADVLPISYVGFPIGMLANRIRKVLPDEENQCAFVEGRFILDGVMTVSELISDLKLNRSMGLILIDLAKAFDSVSWVFLSKVMSSMGFNSSFCNWVHSFVSSARISVLVNGSSSGIFNLE
ncbi:hypothetical protein CTI12_AA371990 [Artemisia annua]|uniref:Reverse transcriptase domain-containing protein n=1 Tax=Artemisia annua TaxID=35608 RepID=A0A2U1MKB3_ARTAN|nr:hypothetical protein CTI12_AA371990 [Artemisia annua]